VGGGGGNWLCIIYFYWATLELFDREISHLRTAGKPGKARGFKYGCSPPRGVTSYIFPPKLLETVLGQTFPTRGLEIRGQHFNRKLGVAT
jgi:hypothetical protein